MSVSFRKKFIKGASKEKHIEETLKNRVQAIKFVNCSEHFLILSEDEFGKGMDILLNCNEDGFLKIYTALKYKIIPEMEKTINKKGK